MPKPASGRRRSASSSKTAVKASWFTRVCRWVLRLALRITLWVALVGVLGQRLLYYLDRSISKTFEGRRWSVPAQVYAQPMELYAGKRLTNASCRTSPSSGVSQNPGSIGLGRLPAHTRRGQAAPEIFRLYGCHSTVDADHSDVRRQSSAAHSRW